MTGQPRACTQPDTVRRGVHPDSRRPCLKTSSSDASLRVLLVVMPCAATSRPAIGVSLLNAILQQHGVECDVAYLNLLFAELLGLDDYVRLIDRVPFRALAGEWVFAAVAWGTSSRRDSYLDNVLRRQHGVEKDDVDVVLRARDAAHGFIEESLRRIDWRRYGLVGFSSYTAQNLASLALADRVKAAHPKIKTVFGGANWRGAAGVSLHERLRFVDYAVSGEGDVSLPLLVRALEDESGQSLKQVPGLIYRENGVTTWNHESRPIEDLDRLPIPDFSDFYRWRQSLPNVLSTLPSVSVEGSRGCWWAKRGPCTFCGMAGPERHVQGEVFIESSRRDPPALSAVAGFICPHDRHRRFSVILG